MAVINLIGQTLGGYRIEQRLGAGGMGAVYRATQVRLGRPVALKVLAPELSDDPEFMTRFVREGQAVAALEHPAIVPIYEADEVTLPNGAPCLFLAMRYISGGSLRDHIRRHGPLKPEQALHLLQQAASGLDEAHRHGIIHRDIKPANLLLEPPAPGDHGLRLFIADFGIAKRNDGSTDNLKTRTGTFMGTPEYMAPEQLEGQPASARSDVYALTVVLYEMLTGSVPFGATTPAMVIYRKLSEPPPTLDVQALGLPVAVAQVLQEGMARLPQQRPRSAGELAAAFAAALGSSTGTTMMGAHALPTVVARPSVPPVMQLASPPAPVQAPTFDAAPTLRRDEQAFQARPPVQRRGTRGVVVLIIALLLLTFGGGFLLAHRVLQASAEPISINSGATAVVEDGPRATEAPPEQTGVQPEQGQITPPESVPTDIVPTESVPAPTEVPSALEATAVPFPQAAIEEAVQTAGGTFGVVVFDQKQNSELYTNGADQVFPAAGLINLPVVITVYHLAEAGMLSLDEQITMQDDDKVEGNGTIKNDPAGTSYSLRELCAHMLRESDNTAGNLVLKRITFEAVNNLMTKIGANNTKAQRLFRDTAAQQEGRENVTSPHDMLLLLQHLQANTLLQNDHSEEILDLMSKNADRSKLPQLLPADVPIAHRSGTLPDGAAEHDVGVVTLSNRSYMIVVMSQGVATNQQGIDAISQISQLVYQYEQELG